MLDPAGYGPVTINKSISINGHGDADINAGSGIGVTITAGANDSVHLRGLTIEGIGIGTIGIRFNTGGSLAIENCIVRNFVLGGEGIAITPSTSSSFSVSNTIASNSATIFVQPTGSAVVTGVLSKVTANNNNKTDGIDVFGNLTTGALKVTIADSEASNNGASGVHVGSVSDGAATAVMLRNVVASNNSTGLQMDTNGILRVAHSVVTGNSIGLSTFGGTLDSYGDNDIDGNTDDNTGVLTVIPTH